MADSPQSPVRPSPSRHSSSWISRLHRKHDAKYHASPAAQEDDANQNFGAEADVEQPLLRDEESRDSNEGAARVQDKFRNCCTSLSHQLWRYIWWILWGLALLLLIVLMTLCFNFYVHFHRNRDYCTSPSCVDAASRLLNNLDRNYNKIDPCVHLDQLVCNGFQDHHYIKADQHTVSTFSLIQEQDGVIVRRVLEQDVDDIKNEDRGNLKKIQDSYNACVNETAIRSTSIAPLQAVTRQIEAFYPVVSPRFGHVRRLSSSQMIPILDTQSITDVFIYMLQRDITALIQLEVKANDRYPEEQVIYASPPRNPGLPKRLYKDERLRTESAETILSEYRQTLAQIMPYFSQTQYSGNSTITLGPPRLPITNNQYLDGIIEFERQLADITPVEEDFNDPQTTYNPWTLEEIETACPDISFSKVIRKMAPKNYHSDTVIVASPHYLIRMCQLINQTANEFLQGFFILSAVRRYAYAIENDTVIEPYKRFMNKLDGKIPHARPDRSSFCVDVVNSELGLILWKFFVDAAFPQESKSFSEKIIHDTSESFVMIIEQSPWVSDNVKGRAIRKVRAIADKVGYSAESPNIMDARQLEEYYHPLTITDNTFFQNEFRSAEFKTQHEWSKLGKPTDPDQWSTTSIKANAYYNPTANAIAFPAGILQEPVFYTSEVPHYLTYGSFGSVVGRELTHALDNKGFQYDEEGRLTNWWDNSTQSLFYEKSQCFVDQYSQYSITGPDGEEHHVNGRLTLSDNMADAGGVHAAYLAWREDDNGQNNKLLPGLDHFTKDQLFFIAFANMYCSLTRKEKQVGRIYSDPRAPNLVRILGTMHNSRAFKEAFNCPTTEPTCSLW